MFMYTFVSRRNVSADKQNIDTSSFHDESPLNVLINQNECILHNHVLAHGKRDNRLQLESTFSSVFLLTVSWDVYIMALREFTGYTWKSRRVMCGASREQYHNLRILWWLYTYPSFSTRSSSHFTWNKTYHTYILYAIYRKCFEFGSDDAVSRPQLQSLYRNDNNYGIISKLLSKMLWR